jgi:hypothetical protein
VEVGRAECLLVVEDDFTDTTRHFFSVMQEVSDCAGEFAQVLLWSEQRFPSSGPEDCCIHRPGSLRIAAQMAKRLLCEPPQMIRLEKTHSLAGEAGRPWLAAMRYGCPTTKRHYYSNPEDCKRLFSEDDPGRSWDDM